MPLTSSDFIEAENKLAEWEAQLRERKAGISLLVELDLRRADCEEIGECIHAIVRAKGQSPTIHWLRDHCPLTLAAFLAAEGSYFYEAGDYWSDVSRRTGISPQTCVNQLGPAFESSLRHFKLTTFKDLDFEDATRYVSKFLAHGGIPDYCLNDFFERLLVRALLKPEWAGMSTRELIKEWRALPRVFEFIDKPVRRFLLYGGRVAEDFLNRCMQLAERALDEGEVASADELRLPARVVESFAQWFDAWTHHEEKARTHRQRTGAIYHSPVITYRPGDGLIQIELPTQVLNRTPLTAAEWRVVAGSASRVIRVHLHTKGELVESDEKTFFLDLPAQSYEFSFAVKNEVARAWRFTGISSEQPLLAFEPDSGHIITWHDALPARALWLIIPANYQLSIMRHGLEGPEPAPIDVEFAPLGHGWENFRGLQVDLSQGNILLIRTSESTLLRIPLQQSEETAAEPELIGRHELCAIPAQPVPIRVFVGIAPRLRIPLNDQQRLEEVLNHTVLAINRTRVSLCQLRYEISTDDHALILPLSQPGCLGSNPVGDFEVMLVGTLGLSATFNVRILPPIRIIGHDTLYIPDMAGRSASVRIGLYAPRHIWVESGNQSGVNITRKRIIESEHEIEYEIEAVQESNQIWITLVDHEVRLPFVIPVRRVRWAIVGLEDAPAAVEWQTKVFTLGRENLASASDPVLIVEVPIDENERTDARCVLYGGEWNPLPEARPHSGYGRTKYLQFRLSTFFDTVRQSEEADLRLMLEGEITSPDRPPQIIQTPLVQLTQEYVVNGIALESVAVEDRRLVLLSWQQPYHVRHRRVRFWSLWRPWSVPLERLLPDEARKEYAFDINEHELPPGAYRLEFTVHDPWSLETTTLVPPPADGANIAEVIVGDKDEFRRYLETLPLGPLRYLESALAGDGQQLKSVVEGFSPEHATPLLEALLSFISQPPDSLTSIAEADIDLLGDTLLSQPFALLQALSERAKSGKFYSPRQLLVRLNIAGKPVDWSAEAGSLTPVDRELLWELWPPFGLFVDAQDLRRKDQDTILRALRYLGSQGEASLQDRMSSDARMFGTQIEPWLIRISQQQLRRFCREHSIIPQGLLDIDTWVTANIEWVEWMKLSIDREPHLTSLLRRSLPMIHDARVSLSTLEGPVVELASKLRVRQTDDGPNLLCNVPFMTGMVALLLRLNARNHEVIWQLAQQFNGWKALAQELYAIAPSLLTRDLCLVEFWLIAHEV